jgi:hypothetical protein
MIERAPVSAPRACDHLEDRVQFFLKTSRTDAATELSEADGRQVLKRLRHEGRKLVEVFVMGADGTIDRFQERTRRRLGSNAVASRTWLCETEQADGWGNGRYVPEPMDAIDNADQLPTAVVLVLAGAEGTPETVVEQLQGLPAAG